MKRTVMALLLLALLVICSVVNLYHLDKLTGELIGDVSLARAAWQQGDTEGALVTLREAIALWESSDGYTHIFIRHDEVNEASDAFFALLGDLTSGETEAAEAICETLLYHLRSIRDMEHVSIHSVF